MLGRKDKQPVTKKITSFTVINGHISPPFFRLDSLLTHACNILSLSSTCNNSIMHWDRYLPKMQFQLPLVRNIMGTFSQLRQPKISTFPSVLTDFSDFHFSQYRKPLQWRVLFSMSSRGIITSVTPNVSETMKT